MRALVQLAALALALVCHQAGALELCTAPAASCPVTEHGGCCPEPPAPEPPLPCCVQIDMELEAPSVEGATQPPPVASFEFAPHASEWVMPLVPPPAMPPPRSGDRPPQPPPPPARLLHCVLLV